MAAIKYEKLVEHFRRDPEQAESHLRESFTAKDVRPKDFDFGRLFEACYGWQEFAACRRKDQLANDVFDRYDRQTVKEAGQGAVTTDAFRYISGQIVYNTILDAYQAEEFVFSKLIPEVETNLLDGEKIAGITEIGDEAMIRKETDPYVLAGVGPNWVFTPPISDRGFIVPLTWEVIFQDRTGKLLEYASQGAKWMGVNKEKRAIDCVIDENATIHRYNWRGTTIATYGDNSGTHTWDNLAASNGMVDWTDIDNALQVFNGLTDPFTGEPITIEPKHIVAVKALEMTARRILDSTKLTVTTPGYATTGNPTGSEFANPYMNSYQLVTSRRLAARLATDTDWFVGDVTAYAKYMVAERLNTLEAPPNNHDEFHRRIVKQYRVNERGQHVVVEPRAMVKNTA